MKVLFLTNHFLDTNGGGSFASRAYINAFSEIADECLLLYPDNGKSITPYIAENVLKLGVPNRATKIGRFFDIYKGRINRYYYSFFKAIKSFQPDIVVFDNSRTSAGYIKKIKDLGIKIITIHHNYEVEYYSSGNKRPLLWWYIFMHYLRKSEKMAVQLSDLNLTLTKQDINLFKQHYEFNNEPKFECLGVFEYKRNEIFHPSKDSCNNNELTFCITGTLESFQTEISLIPFLEDYFPLINQHYPKAKLIIAGRNPSSTLQSLCKRYSNIQLIPNPFEIEKIMQLSNIYICPVSVGGGLKLRIMDGLKIGLPVLCHAVSARGYEAFLSSGCLHIYDDKLSFLSNLKKMIDQRPCKTEIIQQYRACFSFEKGKEHLIKTLNKYKLI